MAFSAEWLGLREPADHAARSAALLARAAACVPEGARVLDLGSGTGSTARAFAAHGFDQMSWLFLDGDAALLDVARQRHPGAETVLGNLADVDALPLEGISLVTASALLDLMPETWVMALAGRLQRARIPFYAALSYDGVMRWTPPHPEDAAITAGFNAHQRGDKGIGAALGPESGARTAAAFRSCGFDVSLADSPWQIGPEAGDLQTALLQGIGEAASEAGHSTAADWTAARCGNVSGTYAVIGHTDLLACPGATSP